MKRVLVIHYSEIGLKGGNFEYFKIKLLKRIKLKLEQNFAETFKVVHSLRRFVVDLPDGFDEGAYVDVLKEIFGVANFKFCYEGSVEPEKLGAEVWSNLPDLSEVESFRVSVKRSMLYEMSSVDLERFLGGFLLKKGIGKKVQMKGFDLKVDVELFNDLAYFSFKTYQGTGGLSSDSQGSVVCLLSSGIDSPVAAYRMMRRGARVIFLHFSGYPYTDAEELEQVKDLVEILSVYQSNTKLLVVKFGEFQKMVSMNAKIDQRYATLLYRRMMYRVAEKVALKHKALGLVTGDSLGQVASQTMENIYALHSVTKMPLIQPLIANDKQETMDLAEKIGTFEISKLECKDSCTLFVGEKAEIRASIKVLEDCEACFDVEEWVESLLDSL